MSSCPCGCPHTVKPGRRYARPGCAQRTVAYKTHRKNGGFDKIPLAKLNEPKKKHYGVSWWLESKPEGFTARAWEEWKRMRLTDEAKLVNGARFSTDLSVPKKASPEQRDEEDSAA